ncbi:unnamed protein product [Miscanthus lutarioriparius]|uniref:Uncharacterized protein n=1 Tax=Miscanthus lutarioriparius TaxID=422564 RepID=A0A811QHE0_9POAL|nr:unnamed protein product [Miscanthus lutarioriparius]
MGWGDSAAAPLLEKTSAAVEQQSSSSSVAAEAEGEYDYVDGCPGCAVDRHKAANPGIPYASLIYVWTVTLCTSTSCILWCV